MFSLTRRLVIGATLGLLALAATPAQAQRFIPPRVLAGYLRLQMTPPFMLSPLYRPAITPAEIAMTADALRFRNIYPDGPALSVATPGFAYPSTLSSMYSGYPGGYSNPYPAYYPGSYGSMGYGSMGYGGGGYGGGAEGSGDPNGNGAGGGGGGSYEQSSPMAAAIFRETRPM